jgi:hypothetical protein
MDLFASLTLPRRPRGRLSAAAEEVYLAERAAFCQAILEIHSTLDFTPSARGWGYILENAKAITKDELDLCESLINDCRKSGELPLDICSADETRAFENLEHIDDTTPAQEARWIINSARRAHLRYNPESFWDRQSHYVQMMVEKIDLRSLFSPTCAEFWVPIANGKGWSDLNLRANMLRRYADAWAKGKKNVLLYCGDHDAAGLNISKFLRSNLMDLAKAVGCPSSVVEELIIDRFGLNRDFIDAHPTLTWIDNLITSSGVCLSDPKHQDHLKPYVQDYIRKHGVRKLEANALVVMPDEARALCRAAILRYIDTEAAAKWRDAVGAARDLVAEEVLRLMREE